MSFSTGKSAAKRSSRIQQAVLGKQQQKESLRLAEEEGEVARRKALSRPGVGGRSLLVKTGATGQRRPNLG